jgi:signal transduction histidine kinase/ActR/RegA family two-component response regulator
MSTLEQREVLIQKRQAEKYINVVRLAVFGFLGFIYFVVDASNFNPLHPGPLPAVGFLVAVAVVYALFVQAAVSRGFFPRYLPWFTTLTDLSFFVAGFGLTLSASDNTFSSITVNLSWGYALLFLLILFSTLREQPWLTLFTGVASLVVYGGFVILYFSFEPYGGFYRDQEFRVVFLFIAGSFSTFHARSLRKAFDRATLSDRLRRATDARLNVLAQHFPGVLLQAEVREAEFHLQYASEGSRELLGLEPPDLMLDPMLFFRRTDRNFRRALKLHFDNSGTEARNWEQEFLYHHPSQGRIWLKFSVTTHLTNQGVQVVNGLVNNISEQRAAAEALRQANQAKSDFLATMSHELRTPLNAILGNADHLQGLATTEDDKKAFADILASGETLLGLIEDILVFSRLEAGRLQADLRPFEWRPQLQLIVDTFRGPAGKKGIGLISQLPAEAPQWVWGDVLRFRQILGNLLANAVKFTHKGHITVEVGFWADTMQILVRDTGIGIPSEIQEKIFEKFVQGAQGKSRPYGGTGLGLAISRSLATLLDGTLTVESHPGQGSTFSLTLPVRGELGLESGGASPETSSVPLAARVLLVEDNTSNQEVATRMLRKLGATVEWATDGVQAVELAEKSYFDLIFMDWQMPQMDGLEATGRIRALPGGQDLVIVGLSGHALPGDRETLLAAGFDDYLSKPVRMDDFRMMLNKYVTSPRRG